jgi:toxin YoeB
MLSRISTSGRGKTKKLHKKIADLIRDINRSPFSGLGKPEPLKYELSGYWSRRINDEHRLVY